MNPIDKLHFVINHPNTGGLLYSIMDYLAEGNCLTEPQIIQINKGA